MKGRMGIFFIVVAAIVVRDLATFGVNGLFGLHFASRDLTLFGVDLTTIGIVFAAALTVGGLLWLWWLEHPRGRPPAPDSKRDAIPRRRTGGVRPSPPTSPTAQAFGPPR